MIYIFDLDGTLADNKHREHFIKQSAPDWDAYFMACDGDTCIAPVATLLHSLSRVPHIIWIWSGRGEIAREKTVAWLKKYNIPYHNLLMRPIGDFTPDEVMKRQWYEKLTVSQKALVVGVFDDRNKVVRMWRELGLTCFQVAEGDF